MVLRKVRNAFDFAFAEKNLGETGLYEKFEKTRLSLPYYQDGRKLRKNGVLAVLLSFSYSGAVADHDAWVRDVRSWIKLSFITQWNALLTFHSGFILDEGGHADALLIPVADNGRITYEHYFGGSKKITELQISYHRLMKQKHGLLRPAPGTERVLGMTKTARLNKKPLPVLPEAYPLETGKEYRERIEALYLEAAAYCGQEKGIPAEPLNSPEKAALLVQSELKPYLDFLEKYGSVKRAEQMLFSAKELQYGIRSMQEQGEKETVQTVLDVLKAGRQYMVLHKIT